MEKVMANHDKHGTAKEILGEMIRNGPEAVKVCLKYFDTSQSVWANKASLSKVNRPILDEFAEFLGIPPLYGEKGIKDIELKTKPRIALRVAQELKALTVPVKCAECNEIYQHKRNGLVPLRCFLCHQPSHDCVPLVSVITSRSGDVTPTLVGEVWICDPCCVPKDEQKGTPLTTKVSSRLNTPGRSRNNSVSIVDPSSELKPEENDETSEMVDADDPAVIEALTDLAIKQKEAEKFPNVCKTTCLLLKEGRCPHGISGKKSADGKDRCDFFHPKLCVPWGKNGEKGCAKGPECRKLHKAICNNATEYKECFEKKCYLVHPKGTNRRKLRDQAGQKKVRGKSERGPSQGKGQTEKPPSAVRSKSNDKKPGSSLGRNGKPGGKPNDKAKFTPAKSQVDFLAIKSLLEKLQKGMSDIKGDQTQMQKTLKTLKADQGKSCSKGRSRVGSGHGCCSQACY